MVHLFIINHDAGSFSAASFSLLLHFCFLSSVVLGIRFLGTQRSSPSLCIFLISLVLFLQPLGYACTVFSCVSASSSGPCIFVSNSHFSLFLYHFSLALPPSRVVGCTMCSGSCRYRLSELAFLHFFLNYYSYVLVHLLLRFSTVLFYVLATVESLPLSWSRNRFQHVSALVFVRASWSSPL